MSQSKGDGNHAVACSTDESLTRTHYIKWRMCLENTGFQVSREVACIYRVPRIGRGSQLEQRERPRNRFHRSPFIFRKTRSTKEKLVYSHCVHRIKCHITFTVMASCATAITVRRPQECFSDDGVLQWRRKVRKSRGKRV